MAIVAGIDEVADPTGQQTIAADEPGSMGSLPGAEEAALPSAELGPQAAQQSDAGQAPAASPVTPGGGSALRDKIISLGMQYLGTPYVWGGTSPGGFDCSGLMQYIFGKNGVKLPRVSYQQADQGHRVGLNSLQPGDLVAWDDSSRNNGADHIAVFVGYKNGQPQILEAPHTGADVRLRTMTPGQGFDASAWGVHLTLPGDN